jgi:hypothetical protein
MKQADRANACTKIFQLNLLVGTGIFFPEIKVPGREADNSPPSRAKNKND